MRLVLFNPWIGPYQGLPPWARVDLRSMATKWGSVFPKAPPLMGPHHQILLCHIQETYCGWSYPSAELQSVYSTAPADWASTHVRRQDISISSNSV